jgi:HEAT repeat protein
MTGTGVKRVLLGIGGLLAVTMAGCADLDLPSWIPFQGPAADKVPGVVAPSERIAQLRILSDSAAKSSPEERKRISDQLASTIREEKDPLIRLEIIRTLGRYPGESADAILKAALSDDDVQVRIMACAAWGKRNDAQAVQLLSESLKADVDMDVRLAAARALGETKNSAAVPALGEALNDSNPALQYRAMLSLKATTGKDLGNDLQRWQQFVKGEPIGPPPSMAERFRRMF